MLHKKLDKMKSLIDELKRTREYDSKDYHLFRDKVLNKHPRNPKRLYLYRNSDKKQLCYGSMDRVKSYMNVRGIKMETVLTDC